MKSRLIIRKGDCVVKKKITAYVISHGHMDIEWYMPLRSYRFWTVEALDKLCQMRKQSPEFFNYVLDGVTCVLDLYLDVRPEAREEIQSLITNGNLSIGPFYSQFDEWLPSAESMVRNCLYGNRECRKYGKIMKAGYLPDNFGHPRQMPQILNNFGIDSLLFMRGMPEIPGGHPDEFLYTGLDGSRVLVSHFRDSYGDSWEVLSGKEIEPMQPRDMPYHSGYLSYEYYMELVDYEDEKKIAEAMIQTIQGRKERYPSGVVPFIAGYDHLPPQAKLNKAMKLANEMQSEIEFVMGDAEGYIQMIRANLVQPMVQDKELIGSVFQHILFGSLSSRSYLKRQNFGAEVLMERYTEPLDAMSSMLGYKGTQPQLDEAWKYLMMNSAHDSIHGSSLDEVHIEMEARYASVRQIATGLSHDAIKHVGKHMNPWWEGSGFGILTFAPTDSGLMQLGRVWLPIGEEKVCIFDGEGKAYPTQIMPREEIETNGIGEPRHSHWPDDKFREVLFLASSKPNKISSFVCKSAIAELPNIAAEDQYLENEYLRVEVKDSLISILDKSTGVWKRGLNLIEEDADAGDAWDYSPTQVPSETVLSSRFTFISRLVESGPVKAVIESTGKMSVPLKLNGDERSMERVEVPVCFEISLERHAKRVDIRLTLENYAQDHRIRLRIPTGIKTDKILSQGHYGIIERPIEQPCAVGSWMQPPTQLLPFREWVAVNDKKTGLAIAVKGIYDYEAIRNPLTNQPDIYLTLLRGFNRMGRINMIQRKGHASGCIPTPGAQCFGKQVIEWSYIPYKVDPGNSAPFLLDVQTFLYPMMTHMVRAEQLEDTVGNEMLPFEFLNDHVQFSAFKRSFDGQDYVLRFFENRGNDGEVILRVNGFNKAFLSNMNEEILEEIELRNGILRIDVKAFKVISILLIFKNEGGILND